MTDQLPQKPLNTPIAANETERLAALHRYRILDTPPEAAFDRITKLAAQIFGVPTALISLVDESRAWFKSCVGFAVPEVPRDATVCSFAILTEQPLIVPDARLDDRFACNPFVQTEPGLRFYAGAPLLSQDGFNLGTLCLLDTQPREPLTPLQQATLVDLAALVVDELELRLAAHKIAQVDAALQSITQGVATVTGDAFMDALVQHFADVLDADYAYVGLVGSDQPPRIRTIATFAHGQIVDNLEYLLQDTPCWEVLEQRKICCYPRNVQARFPDAPLLKPLAVESYIATPFFDPSGTPLGLLGIMDSKPLEQVQLAESLLTIFASRIATELERQQADRARQAAEEKYRQLNQELTQRVNELQTLFDLLPIGVAIAEDPDCTAILANRWMSELIRVPIGQNASHSAPPAQRPAYRLCRDGQEILPENLPMQWAARHQTEVRDEVVDLVHPEGSLVKLLCYASPLLNQQGQVRGVLGAFVDITQRVLTETALRQSQERLSLAIDNAGMATWDMDLQTGQGVWSESHFRLLGYHPLPGGEATYDLWFDRVHPADQALVRQAIAEAQQTGSLYRLEYRIQRADTSEIRWMSAFGKFLYNEAEQVVRFVGVLFDASERKQAETELQLHRDRLAFVLETTGIGLWLNSLPLSGLNWDNRTRQLFFVPPEVEPTFDLFWSRLHPDDHQPTRLAIEQAIQERTLYEIDHRAVHPETGEIRWIRSTGKATYGPDGTPLRFDGINYDISDRKTAETEREILLQQEQAARAEAERANRIKDEFLAVLSHELRSPLNPILGWSKLLQKGKLDSARQTEALKTIERNAKLQAQLVEDLLDISRIMQGKLSLTAAPVCLNFVIAAAIETVRLAAEAKQIQIRLDLDPAITPVAGDVARLQQVVWNLLSNAVKFTPPNGQVRVELRQLRDLAQIRVIDTGKGIQPQFLPHVFEYFRQEDGSTTRKFGGLGLGLAIARQIVEMHGGSLGVESAGEDQGATFTVQLPLSPQAPRESEPPQPQTTASALSNLHILLVDDEIDTREFEAFLLAQSGAKVTAVSSGVEALQALDQLIPDLLVSDIGMADMDGYQLIEHIRSRSPDPAGQMPAIALTAYAAELDQQKALQSGFQAHLSKPVQPEELLKVIIRMLGNQV